MAAIKKLEEEWDIAKTQQEVARRRLIDLCQVDVPNKRSIEGAVRKFENTTQELLGRYDALLLKQKGTTSDPDDLEVYLKIDKDYNEAMDKANEVLSLLETDVMIPIETLVKKRDEWEDIRAKIKRQMVVIEISLTTETNIDQFEKLNNIAKEQGHVH